MTIPILTTRIKYEPDLATARHRARQTAQLFGLDSLQQTRLATAVSEITRNALRFGGGGTLEFLIEEGPGPQALTARIADRGPGIANLAAVLDGALPPTSPPPLGLRGSRRLVDRFAIESVPGQGTTVALSMFLPGDAWSPARVGQLVGELTRHRPQSFVEELEQQNRELLRTLDELRRHEVELLATDRRKDEFLAMLAHELRNPLAPIRNAVDYLQRQGPEQEDLEQARAVIVRQLQHLTRLVDDLLDVSRITQGKIILRKQAVEASAVVTRAVEMAQPFLDVRRHALTVSTPREPLWLEADVARLSQVLGNLLNNAAKYTEPGGRVSLTVQREAGQAVFEVRDTGVGIAPELLPRVFDLFIQADRSLDRPDAGLGIGLTIVHQLVALHGGSVTAHSDGPGKGSAFTVRLPALAVAPGQGAAADARNDEGASAAPRRILVVDDNVDAADSLALLLRLFGHQVRTAYDGPQALRAVTAQRPEVVLLDIGLPRMDGFEVARRLRAEHPSGSMLLIALTGYGQEDDRRRALEVGFDHHLTKPVEVHVLQRLLSPEHARG